MRFSISHILCCLLVLLSAVAVQAQIFGDTVENKHSARTSVYRYDDDVISTDSIARIPDTSFVHMQRYDKTYTNGIHYQNLGVIGSAYYPVLPTMPTRLGIGFGHESFRMHHNNLDSIRHYDTRSPYANMYYVQGSTGEQWLNGMFTRNVNRYINFGFSVGRMTAQNQIAKASRDRNVDQNTFTLFASAKTKNETYMAAFAVSRLRHTVNETGGVPFSLYNNVIDTNYAYASIPSALYDPVTRARTAQSDDKMSSIRFTHRLNLLGRAVAVFHRTEYNFQRVMYQDANASTYGLYSNYYFDTTTSKFSSFFREFKQTAGLSGKAGNLQYRVYGTYRFFGAGMAGDNVLNNYRFYDNGKWFDFSHSDTYVGGMLKYAKDSVLLSVVAEQQIGFKALPKDELGILQKGNDYRVQAQAAYRFLFASAELMQVSPTYRQTLLVSNHFQWSNSFVPTTYAQFGVGVRLKNEKNLFIAEGKTLTAQDLIIYDSLAAPAQLSETVAYSMVRLFYGRSLWRFHVDVDARYANTNNATLGKSIPQWIVMPSLYYQGRIFKSSMAFFQTGVDGRLMTAYEAPAYMPATQQFYYQSGLQAQGYMVLDAFINIQLNHANVFIKVTNLLEDLDKNGYYTTPGYLGMRRAFMFGIRWNFFD